MGASDIFNKSDDEILNMSAPPVTGDATSAANTAPTEEAEIEADAVIAANGDTAVEVESNADTNSGQTASEEDKSKTEEGTKSEEEEDPAKKSGSSEAEDDKSKTPVDPNKAAEDKSKTKDAPVADNTPPDYQAFYNQIMTPFKANGKTIELKSPDEAIKLMQMGANYTRQMQQLAPQRKLLTMLQNNDLLDESKLSFLIDLDKKNPDAIKKLIKDSGIDPLEVNTEDETAYKPGNHQVTDEELKFNTTLEDIRSTQEGVDTLRLINTTWDQQSKEALWSSPEIMRVIHEQRESKVYDQISAEVDRRKMLGSIPADTPFLAAYKLVGDDLIAQKALKVPAKQTGQTPVITRPATVKSDADNNDKVRAAAETKTKQTAQPQKVNPLAMSDDDFLKLMENRV